MSNITKTLAVVSLLAPMTAQPLGIGDIELHSVLNQKLNAVIKLHLAGENPSDVSVRLASPEKFDQAGVPWSYILSKVKFSPVVKPDGSMLIKVTSNEAFVEPFLNFLLEVSWPQGNLVREFTLLIDPPTEYGQPVFPVADSGELRSEPIADTVSDREARPRSVRSSTRVKRPVSSITPDTPASGEYGPTQSQDSLWRIADRLAVKQGVTTSQMMNALFRANPDAFIRGDMDLLKVGAVLKIPETQAILQESQPSTRATAANKALELVAPNDSAIPEHVESAAAAKVQGTATADVGGSGQGAGKDLELQARIDKLEQQLNMMQQMLALKDQQLATLQSKGKNTSTDANATLSPVAPTTAVPAAVVTTAPVAATSAPVVEQAGVAVQPSMKPSPTVTQKPLTTVAKPQATTESEETSPILLGVGAIAAGTLSLLGLLWWRKRKIEERTNSESMFASASQIKMPDADSTLSVPVVDITNAASYDVGTVGESSFISDFTPSDFDAFDTDQNEVDPLSEADVYLAYGRYQQAEDLIRHAIRDVPERDDYKLKLLEILYANESRDAFAAFAQELSSAGKQTDRVFWTKVSDMGKELVSDHPLFGGAAEFSVTAPVAHSSHDVPKATNSTAVASFALEDEEAMDAFHHDDDLLDLNDASLPDLELMNDINSELAELELNSDMPSKKANRSLDFDLGSFNDATVASNDKAASSSDNFESIDFDLNSLSLDTVDSKAKNASDTVEDVLESFDFNFDLESSDANGAGDKAADNMPLDMNKLESFEFPEFNTPVQEPAIDEKPAAVIEASTDEFDFNFDFETPSAQIAEADSGELGVFDLTDMDEFETKIDLAKAYIDMGDKEMAKNIAKEVLDKGTKEQKQAAQAIIDEL